MERFRDRREAGALLARALKSRAGWQGAIVLALPRGGVPVAWEVARSLGAPLDIFVVRKLGLPGHEELAMGAIASGGVRFLNEDVVAGYGVSPVLIDTVSAREMRRIEDLEAKYRPSRKAMVVTGRDVIVVDDGLATGASMHAAVIALRRSGVRRITVAVPVGARETCERLEQFADDVVCLLTPRDFRAVGLWYEDFNEVSDEEVRALLQSASSGNATEVEIDARGVPLAGTLSVPHDARGLVLFAHGSGSSRHSPRNRFVAGELCKAKFATLLMDLLTKQEERAEAATGYLRFDIDLLASRLAAATEWTASQQAVRDLPIGYFGASTGAAAALVASVDQKQRVTTIVSRGGRPDLAGDSLPHVTAPTLLIVGSRDEQVLELNRKAKSRMNCPVEIRIVPGATHLFEEPGTLEQVAALARAWVEQHLSATTHPSFG
jgi:putative phosphoribosyl transferase